MRCSHILENGLRCVRLLEKGSFCYQHTPSIHTVFPHNSIEDVNNIVLMYLVDEPYILTDLLKDKKLQSRAKEEIVKLSQNKALDLPYEILYNSAAVHETVIPELIVKDLKYRVTDRYILNLLRNGNKTVLKYLVDNNLLNRSYVLLNKENSILAAKSNSIELLDYLFLNHVYDVTYIYGYSNLETFEYFFKKYPNKFVLSVRSFSTIFSMDIPSKIEKFLDLMSLPIENRDKFEMLGSIDLPLLKAYKEVYGISRDLAKSLLLSYIFTHQIDMLKYVLDNSPLTRKDIKTARGRVIDNLQEEKAQAIIKVLDPYL